MKARPTFRLPCAARPLRSVILVALSLCAACSPPPPRSYDFFFQDSIARDGALARCDRDPDAARDIECANARRAATAVQLQEERSRRQLLERESEQKLEALRQQFAAEQRAAREAEAAAIAAAKAAYEAQWQDERSQDPPAEGAAAAPAAALEPAVEQTEPL